MFSLEVSLIQRSNMAVVEGITAVVLTYIVSVSKCRRIGSLPAMIASLFLTFNFPSSRKKALVACHYFVCVVLPRLLNMFISLLTASYLYTLLNVIILTIVITGILDRKKRENLPFNRSLNKDVGEKHPVKLVVPSTSVRVVEKSAENFLFASVSKQEDHPWCDIESSEPLSLRTVPGKSKEAGTTSIESGVLGPHLTRIQKKSLYSVQEDMCTSDPHESVVNKPVAKPDIEPLLIDQNNFCYARLKHLVIDDVDGDCELSTDEINERVRAFIASFHNQLKEEHRDSS